MTPPRITYLSLGAGVQSSALLVMSALGLRGCPRADVAVFADTQDEPAWVYQHLGCLTAWAAEHSLEILRVSHGRLSETIRRRDGYLGIPVFSTDDEGNRAILRRQCTGEFKIKPIARAIRSRLGYAAGDRIPANIAHALIGISIDEAHRMKPAWWKWVTNRYPLIDAGMTRSACVALLEAHDLPVPQKSACVFCPFHSDRYWADLKAQAPMEWDRAVHFDEMIRQITYMRIARDVFVHSSLRPLSTVTFDTTQARFDFDGFGNECEGYCGV